MNFHKANLQVSASAVNPYVISSIARLVEYGCRFAAIGDEIKAYRDLLEGTTALRSCTKTLRTELSTFLTIKAKNHVDGEINPTKSALDRGRKVKRKRVEWLLNGKEHKAVLT